MSELIKIFSPENEPFEVSKANARDLTTHRGWTYGPNNGTPAAAPVEETEVETETETEVETETEDDSNASESGAESGDEEADDEQGSEEADADDAAEEEGTEEEGEDLLTSEEDFADFDKEAVVAYLEKNFPEAAFDKRSGRDKLVAFAIEQAA